MTFSEYQRRAMKTAVYPEVGNNLAYPTLGLCGEAGEIANKVKKILRDDGDEIIEKKREEIKKELGDCLWYIAAAAYEINYELDSIAQDNIEKLKERQERGTLQGSGDER